MEALKIEDVSNCTTCTNRDVDLLKLMAEVRVEIIGQANCPECGRVFQVMTAVGEPVEDHGKFRLYRCVCGGSPHRPLTGTPKPCDNCGANLENASYVIEDQLIYVRRLMAGDAR